MQDIIRKIISIDQNARDIILRSESEIKLREDDSRRRLELIRAEIMEKAKSESQARYDEIIKSAQAEADSILSRNDDKIRQMEQYFASIKDNLEKSLFERIFLSEEGKINL
ncbi:MAG TPA: hypothetical protein GX505_03625 [Clostridiales bacterium]|nr:hypothetical protein [Clostridiales bacterium]